MAKSENQKIKLLKLYEILCAETDEDNPLKAKELMQLLEDIGIKCERKTFYSDIKLMKEYGIDVQSEGNRYFIAKRDLDIGQIRFLIDAVQSSAFLTKKQTTEICSALSMLAGFNRAELLRENVICFDKLKHRNDGVLDTVETINHAIEKDRRISFKYFDLNIGCERKYRKDGERYVSNPVGLVFNGGYYYLVCYSEKYDDLTTYRVDRIAEIAVCEENRIHSEKEEQFIKGELKDKITAFGMWDNEVEKVKLIFECDYINDIYDKFGFDVSVFKYDEDHYYINERVSLSDTFFGWCASYGKHIRIDSPEFVKQKMVEMLHNSLSLYE